MDDSYLGEIRLFAGDFVPEGWHLCDGSQLSITGYSVLYSLLGTAYGGDGNTFFCLPDLRGRVPMHQGEGYPLGSAGGCEKVVLNHTQIPRHRHPMYASGASADRQSPNGNVPAAGAPRMYSTNVASAVAMAPATIAQFDGGFQGHDNMQPWLAMNYIISMDGALPPRP